MATLRDLKRQIGSVKNIAKVTEALQTVSAVKFRKAEARVKKARPYAENVEQMMCDVARSASANTPLLAGREVNTVLVASITADRGLAGGFNAQVIRRSLALEREARGNGQDVRWLAVGKKGRSTLRFRRYEIECAWTDFTDRPTYGDAAAIANKAAELFTNRDVDRVVVVYNHYVSPLTQTVTVEELLPIPRAALEDEEEKSAYEIALEGDVIYEPEPELILARLLPTYLETTIFRALLESAASEHGARMTAMRNATKNAGELIDRLTLEMNRARQAEITQEILEVVAGADALTQ